MQVRKVWSNEGIFYSTKGRLAPKGLRSRIAVPSQRTIWESAAMAELASRIGLHLTDLPLPIFEHLFVFDQLDPRPAAGGHGRHFQIVLGYEWDWLAGLLKERVEPLREARLHASREAGLLYYCEDEEGTVLVISGTSPEMTLHAARALVSGKVEEAQREKSAVLLIPRETVFSQEGSPSANRDVPKHLSLHNLFTSEGLYQQREGELLPTVDVCLHVSHPGTEQTVVAVELAARLALSAGYVCYPVTCCPDEEHPTGRFAISFDTEHASEEQDASSLTLAGDASGLIVRSHSSRLVSFVREVMAEGFAPLDDPQSETWRHRFAALQSKSPDVQLRSQLGMQAFFHRGGGEAKRLVIPEHLAHPIELWHGYLGTSQGESPITLEVEAENAIWTAEWKDDGELHEMESYLRATVSRLKEGDGSLSALEVEVTTTSSEDHFAAWSAKLQTAMREEWGIHAQFVYRDANKSGLNWAMQEVLPRIGQMAGIHSVELCARSFQPQEKHLDLVHRFLQELYPFDAILSKKIGLPLENIHLRLEDGPDAPMFSVIAKGVDGQELATWSWEGWAESHPYMPGQPERGHVMVPFAGLRVYQADPHKQVASKSFSTNPYRFWKWYQQEVLPQVFALVGTNPGVPKFSRLECHVGMDAVEKNLPHLEENSSVLEALHEDIYFYTLHAMHDHGKRVGDPEWDAPGGILPFMHVQPGAAPWARVSLYAFPTEHQVTVLGDDQKAVVLKPLAAETFQDARVVGLASSQEGVSFSFAGFTEPVVEEICGAWLAAAAFGRRDSEQTVTHSSAQQTRGKSVKEDVFVNEDTQQWLEQRKDDIPGRVTPIDFSLNGRWIWLVELFEQEEDRARVYSVEKHGLYKPTFFINARHHANEVSSTNAALQLIEQITAKPDVLQAVNLVIVPLENVDGAALHARMAKENPRWKLHAARYNACGLEFAKYRFQEGVPFGESRVYPKVWKRWAPDIVLDDHGIPSHEWIQPFSGYNSPPRFPVSYWIPSARMYTIWRELSEANKEQREAYASLRAFVTKRLDEDQDVAADNRQWLETYRRWGHAFDSVHFPIELSNGSIAYTRHSPKNKGSHDLIERFSDWVTADLMTEVNDETVYGKELSACRHAHHVVHQAIVDWMKERGIRLEVRRNDMENGTVRVGLERSRPL